MAERSHAGRLELTWTDKDQALLSVGDGKYDYTFVDPADWRVSEVRLLHEVDRIEAETPEERPEDLLEPTSDNLLITGDAMHVLDALTKIPEYAERYLGKVKLVYIDPPFNTGQAFPNYEDNITHSIWLTMLRDRLRQIKPLLTSNASVWVHLDHAESHRCRSVLDEEMGADNFVAEVAWQKADAPRNDTTGISTSQDVILVYRASEAWRPNRMLRLEQSNTSRYKSRDGDPIPWRDKDATAGKAKTNHPMVYAVQHPVTGGLMYPNPGRCWAKSQTWMLEQMNEYAPYQLRDIGDDGKRAVICGVETSDVKAEVPAIMLAVPVERAAEAARARYDAGMWPELVMLGLNERLQRKKHLEDNGRVPETLWLSTEVGGNLRGKNEIKALFPGVHPFATPKPEQLLHRIIHIATDPGDIVLDCFAGSGTTAAVAHKMGRRWVTSELLPETTEKWTLPRLRKVLDGELGGISTVTKRAAEEGTGLPAGMRADDAFKFQQLLKRVLATPGDPVDEPDDEDLDDDLDDDVETDGTPPLELNLDKELATVVRRLAKSGDGPLDVAETKTLLALLRKMNGSGALDVTAKLKTALNKRTKTREVTTRTWFGGGGFTHLEVGPSMFVECSGMLLLADWATQSELSQVICAQLSVRYRPEGIFAGKRGRTRFVVIDGMVGASTVEAITDRCDENEVAEVWATQIEDGASDMLRKLRPGSSLHAIPAAVLDSYRRKHAATSPFRSATIARDGDV